MVELRIGAALCLVGLGLTLAACGDDDAGPSMAELGEGCTTDSQCKGDRICIERECRDPDNPSGERDGSSTGGGSDAGSSTRSDGGPSGTAGRGSAGSSTPRAGSGPMPVIDDPELEAACMLNCDARHAAACPMNIGSLDQCNAQCLIIDEQNQGYCGDEQRDQFACLASGGYACVSGYPQPKSTCLLESQALSQCVQLAPCRTYCARRASACGDDESDCFEACRAEQTGFNDAICGIYYTQLVGCLGMNLSCDEDGAPVAAACDPALAEIADCIGRRNHECDGFCWAAEQRGCGSETCVADCKAKADETSCGHYYRNAIDCAFQSRELNLTCEDGEPTLGPECASQLMQYTTCMNP